MTRSKQYKQRKRSDDDGYCIRCHFPIGYDAHDPFCFECGEVWEKYRNWLHEEHYCHRCGRRWRTSRARPFCKVCFHLPPPEIKILPIRKTPAEFQKLTMQIRCPPHNWIIYDWVEDRKQERCSDCGKIRDD